ncbi:DUF1156 domain-containing protein [Anaerolineales bacterium HSG24]|nr:DUF1156 domain-containing protein [Anaerolineales bacterium HSG24]
MKKRLIEIAFPLKQTSLASVHEKNVRHGHISTLHIWPARRPLAACRAALLATLLPDPGTDEERKKLVDRIGGRVTTDDNGKEGVEDGVLKWKNESNADMDWFREQIREAYGGRAPKVLDPFAGGGAIPLEAMRLGCETTAIDINPVAWFILKCTLEYPQKLAGQTHPLPVFALKDEGFMTAYLKAKGFKGNALKSELENFGFGGAKQMGLTLDSRTVSLEADLAWHVRAWGLWVLKQARQELAEYYPTYAEFEPLKGSKGVSPFGEASRGSKKQGVGEQSKIENRKSKIPQLVPLHKDGTPNTAALNAEFDQAYLDDSTNPRWVAKPTVAYLWARTVPCKQCRATIPLLKTRWLCKKAKKKVVLTMTPNEANDGVVFGIETNPAKEENGAGTMSRGGTTCPCCGTIMTMKDLRLEGQAGHLGETMTAVVMNGLKGKEYRLPTPHELEMVEKTATELERVYADIPFGLPDEPLPPTETLGFRVQRYGIVTWRELFTPRQLLALGTFVKQIRQIKESMVQYGYSSMWFEAVIAYLSIVVDRQADYGSAICMWHNGRETLAHTFTRFALPMTWDFCEVNCFSGSTGDFGGALDWVARVIETNSAFSSYSPSVQAVNHSAIQIPSTTKFDVIQTDPPYYDSIPYADSMDFFYVWLRRTLHGLTAEFDTTFKPQLSPKWDHENNDGELIDDASRFAGDAKQSKINYEDGMARVFQACYLALETDGRLVVVFANKQPDAWETLVSALVRAGFIVTGSLPIATEMSTRMRAKDSAALASSIWLVCKKRSRRTKPGWDNQVLTDMEANISEQLYRFWDAGIRGPDFVWAATGPAMEAFSQYPVVRKANEPGQTLSIAEFLRQVRRMVVNFVVGRVLQTSDDGETAQLDDLTTYYLLHRNDFGLLEAPSGACILYALTCNLSDRELADKHDLVLHKGSTLKLKGWVKRKLKDEVKKLKPASQQNDIALETPTISQPRPLINHVHLLMHLWKNGDQLLVDRYLQQHSLTRHKLFHHLLQAIIELAPAGSEERAVLESISNYIVGQGGTAQLTF